MHIHQLLLNMNFQHVRGEREIKETLTFTSEGRLVGHGLGADITGSGITDADRHKVVSMTTFVFLLLVLKNEAGSLIIAHTGTITSFIISKSGEMWLHCSAEPQKTLQTESQIGNPHQPTGITKTGEVD